jgi:hypothetical protein
MAKKRNLTKKPPAKPPASPPKGAGEATEPHLGALYGQIREILATARDRAWQAVNTVMVEAHWEVGRVIVQDEQAGKERAGYGKRVLEGLARRLQAEFGKGFDQSNLRNMRAFFLIYPIRDALRHELSWTHYRSLLRVDNPDARATRPKPSTPAGPRANWIGRSTRRLEVAATDDRCPKYCTRNSPAPHGETPGRDGG